MLKVLPRTTKPRHRRQMLAPVSYSETLMPALRLARSSRIARRIAKVLIVALAVTIMLMVFAPWQQSVAYAALIAAFEQVKQTREAVKLAEEMAQRERRNFEVGASDLLKVTLREQYAAESAIKEVDAMLEYHQARADYRAALAADAGE